MSIDGPSRCALLDWLLKPLNLLQRKGSTKIDGNNQYVPAALFTSQKLFTSIFLFLFYHNPLLSSFLLFLLCHLLLVIPHPSANPPPRPRQNRPVCLMSWTSCLLFCWQPSGPCALETAWHCWDSGYRTSFPRWDPFQNVTHIQCITPFPGCHSIEETSISSHFTHNVHWQGSYTILLYAIVVLL